MGFPRSARAEQFAQCSICFATVCIVVFCEGYNRFVRRISTWPKYRRITRTRQSTRQSIRLCITIMTTAPTEKESYKDTA